MSYSIFLFSNWFFHSFEIIWTPNMGGGQPFEQPHVERPIFWNFEIPNIKRTKDELFDFSNFEFLFIFILFIKIIRTQKYMIIHRIIINLWNFNSFPNCKILKIFRKYYFRNFMIFEIFWIENFGNIPNW